MNQSDTTDVEGGVPEPQDFSKHQVVNLTSIDVYINDLAFGHHKIAYGAIVLEESVLDILSIHQIRDFTVAKVTLLLLDHALKDRIRLEKTRVVAKSLP
jgi:hypothetical protein